jgi:trehalose/maltose hydrolase-like predicted phosphorylase
MALPPALDRRFEAVVFDWDGTAVPDRRADGSRLRMVIEDLCERGLAVAVVSGTNLENVDGQLSARPEGPGRLHLCLNRGSEVFVVGPQGPEPVERRTATAKEEAALDGAASGALSALARRGLEARVVSSRLNRRKLDLIPEPEWSDPPKAGIADLEAAVEARLAAAGIGGLGEAVELAQAAAREAGLDGTRVTSDAKHVEIGLTDKSDSGRWIFRSLWRRGIDPWLVLVAGDEWGPLGGLPGSDSLLLVAEADGATSLSVGVEPGGVPDGVEHLPGGPGAFLDVLEDQLRRRREGAVPDVARHNGWSLVVESVDPVLERVHGALLTISDGSFGTSGSPIAPHSSAAPGVLAAGVYVGEGARTELVAGPVWTLLPWRLADDVNLVRVLDLRTGLTRQELTTRRGPVEALLVASRRRPGTVALRAEGPRAGLEPEACGGTNARIVCGGADGRITACLRDTHLDAPDGVRRIERLGAYVTDPDRPTAAARARERLAEVERAGFEELLVEQREAWAERWADADVVIEGDDELQLAVRFALHQLMAAVGEDGEAAVGARGLSGPAYRGHVFWDADVFVLPFLAATHPPSARAMLEYRVGRLPAARKAAAALGYAGARFPWESADSGADVTPRSAVDRTGAEISILTGEQEEHVVADVAWAAACYADWTGDEAFLAGPGRGLLVETARYWASRARVDRAGRAHVDGVIGPDEYHEEIDDNAFTNVMARWNLRRAAALGGDEAEDWSEIAAALVDGYDPERRLYEQFDGFFQLEPLVIADLAPRRPIAADALLGHRRIDGAQVVKQADVLMLHHLVPDEVEPGSLEPNLAFYEPRTAHGSSLSPGVHASLLAKAGRLDEAVALLRLAARIDLDDLTGTTAGGLHLAAMGSVWQALAWGFLGLRPRGPRLALDPRLPSPWSALEIQVRYRGSRVSVRVEAGLVTARADPPIELEVGPEGLAVLADGAGVSVPSPAAS